MRVLHVNSELTWRGGERQVELLAQYSVDRVFSTIACDRNSELHQRLCGKYELAHFAIRNGFDLKAAIRLKRLAQHVDLIHCHTPKAQSVALLAKLLGCEKPVLSTKRTSFPIGENYFSKLKYRKTDQVVCVSQASADVLKKQLPELDIKVIHSAIDRLDQQDPIDLATLIPETKHRKVIGYVAAITDEKNPNGFIETAQAVLGQNDDYCFLWIGEGDLKSEVQSQLGKLELSDRVILTGFQKNIGSWIAHLDLLFFPSLSEGFPTTLLQAMQSSVPVVASDLPSIREIIKSGETGLLSDTKEVEGFASKIREVLINDDLRKNLTANALRSMEQYYADQMAEKYIGLYQEMLGLS